MSALVEVDQAARLHRAEDRWLDQCADRLRRSRTPSRPPSSVDRPPSSVEPVETTTSTPTPGETR